MSKNVKNTVSSKSGNGKKLYHLTDQQWKIWFCIDFYVKSSNKSATDYNVVMNSQIFEICKVSKDYRKPSDKVISDFNTTIWDCINSSNEKKSRIIVPQKNDLYTIDLQLYRTFCNQILTVRELQNNMIINKDIQRQVILSLKDYQNFTASKSV